MQTCKCSSNESEKTAIMQLAAGRATTVLRKGYVSGLPDGQRRCARTGGAAASRAQRNARIA
eukprot:6214719-Pleurochrysis_carterae.AAC.4